MNKLIGLLMVSISIFELRAQKLEKYNMKFTSPATDSWGSMVCGNGDVSSNVWIDQSGNLQFYIGKTDSRDNISKLLKITQVTITCVPAIFKDVKVYNQEFDIATASFRLKTSKGNLRFWVDANSTQIFVEIDAKIPVAAQITTHVWRRNAFENKHSGFPFNIMVEADSLVSHRKNDILIYHHNHQTELFNRTLALFNLSENEVENPLKNRVFGLHLYGDNLKASSDSTLNTIYPSKKIKVKATIFTQKSTTTKAWVDKILSLSKKYSTVTAQNTFENHRNFWKSFWNKSYIEISSNNPAEADTLFHINRAYLYNRYVMYLASKGDSPIQFNGSTWLVDTKNDTIHMSKHRKIIGQNTDFRVWTFMQAGDRESMHSLLGFYANIVYPRMRLF